VQTTSPRRRVMGQVSVTAGAGGGEQTLTYTDWYGVTHSAETVGEAGALVADLAASTYNAEAAGNAKAAEVEELTQRLESVTQQLAALQAVGEQAGGAALALTAAVTSADPTSDVEQLCRLLLPPGDKRDEALRLRGGSIGAIGRNSASVADMSARSQRDLAKLTQLLLSALLNMVKGGAPDPSGVFKLLMEQRNGLQAELKAAVLSVDGVSPLNHPLCVELKLAICRCKRLGMRDVARQLMAIVTASMSEMGVTSSSLQDFFSDESGLTFGEEVKVILGRYRAYRLATVVQVGGVNGSDGQHEGAGVLVKLKGEPVRHGDADMDAEEAGAGPGQHHGADAGADDPAGAAAGTEVFISRDRLIAVGDVRITNYFVQESKKHAMAHFPGGRVEVPKRSVHRMSDATVTHLVGFIASPACLRILDASTHRQSTVERVDYRANLYKAYHASAATAEVEPVGRTFFYEHWPANIKDAAAQRDCICGTCYHCGSQTIAGLHKLCDSVAELFAGVDGVAAAVAGIKVQLDMVEAMFEREYYHHHAMHSSSASHCRNHALSAPYGGEQGAPCDAAQHLDENGVPRSDDMPTFEGIQWEHDEQCLSCNKRSHIEKNWPVHCDCCEAVVHNKESCLEGESPIDIDKDEFKCRDCVRKLAEQLHTMDCGKCNLRFDVVESLGRLLELVGGLGHPHSEAVERWMAPRLKDYASNLEQYAAHKIQDAHQSAAQRQELVTLGPDEAQIIADFAAKLKPARAEMTLTEGFGDKASISRHTITAAFRASADDLPDSTAGELQENFITVTYNLVCDDSDQNAIHALQGVNAAQKLLHAQFPRITKSKLTTDGATDYAGSVFVRGVLMTDTKPSTGMDVLSHNHSIPGEGKAVNDMINGLMNQAMTRLRARGGAGASQQTASEVATAMDICALRGVQNLVSEVEKEEVEVVAPTGITKYYAKERVDNEGVRCRRYTGIGRGTVLCIPCIDADRAKLTGLMARTALACSVNGSTSEGQIQIKESRRLRKLHAEEAQQRKVAARGARAAAVTKQPLQVMRAGLRAALAAATASTILSCPTCTMRFMLKSKHNFEQHVHKCGARGVPQPVQEQITDHIGKALVVDEDRCSAALGIDITVNSQAELDALGLRAEEDEEEGEEGSEEEASGPKCCIGVVTSTNGYVVAFAAPGAVVCKVSPPEYTFWGDDGLLDVAAFPVTLTLRPPPRAVLPRGWARKASRRAAQILTEEQETFLHAAWVEDSKIASAVLVEKMNAHFEGREELQLSEEGVQRFLNRTYSRVRAAEKLEKEARLAEHAAALPAAAAAAAAAEAAAAAAAATTTTTAVAATAAGGEPAGARRGGAGRLGGRGGRGGRGAGAVLEETEASGEPVAEEGGSWTWWGWACWLCGPCWPSAAGASGA
jgi:hypothetical protein